MTDSAAKPRRRWPRFSVRSLLLLIVLIAVPLAWKFNQVRNQRLVVAEITNLNGQIIYHHEMRQVRMARQTAEPPGPKWLRALLGEDFFAALVWMEINDPRVSDETIALVSTLPDLKELHIRSDQLSDRGLGHLAGLKTLKYLNLVGRQITDNGLEQIAKFKQLKGLDLNAEKVSDDGLAQIAKLTKLHQLSLGTSGFSQDRMNITDEGLLHLQALKNLRFLQFNSSKVTRAGVDKLQKALPDCKIVWNHYGPNDAEAVVGQPN